MEGLGRRSGVGAAEVTSMAGDQGQSWNSNSRNQLLSVGEEGSLMKCFAHSQDFFRCRHKQHSGHP